MVTIASQFNGPPNSGNGGYVCGMLAEELMNATSATGPIRSMLLQPPPLDTPLTWEQHAEETRLLTTGGAVIAKASLEEFDHEALPCPTWEEAEAGRAAYPGFRSHPFDRCFTCGTDREEGDGLRVFTGPIGPDRVAGTWTAHEAFDHHGTVDLPTAWAVIDCPGGWAADFTKQPMVLGRMSAKILREPKIGEPCIALGGLLQRDGRKITTASALYSAEAELLGRSEQTWIAVDIEQFS